MKKYLLLLLPLIAVFLHGCQKINGTILTGTNNTSATYQPLTAGSTWTYRVDYTVGGWGIDTNVITMSAKTYTINSRVYQQAYETHSLLGTAADTGYYYVSNHEYSTMKTVGASAGGNSPGYTFEMTYLKDNLPVGGTWSASTNALSLNGKIVEKGITKKVAGKTYTNVIHTNIAISIFSLNVTGGISYDIYVAPNVGIIHIDLNQPGYPPVPQDLIAYSIK